MSESKPNCPKWDGNLRKSPCSKNCTERFPGCHALSEEYAKYRAAKDAELSKKNAVRAGSYSLHERLLVNHKLIDKSKKGTLGK